MRKEIIINDAEQSDSPLIAEAIMEAIGEEICKNMAGENYTLEEVRTIFTELAEIENSQYSFRNSRVATDSAGHRMGVCVSYDGAQLIPLRRKFFEKARDVLGWDLSLDEIDTLPGETSDDEFYLDTLMVLPQYRRCGVGSALIADAAVKAKSKGKPLGLLVDPDNERAHNLYISLGFERKGIRRFAGVDMNHLQLSVNEDSMN